MLDELRNERVKKLELLKSAGKDPYPARLTRTHRIGDVRDSFGILVKSKKRIAIVGRVRGLRKQGSLIFADLEDESGSLQLVVKKEDFSEFTLFYDALDIGDFLNAFGTVFETKRGEKSLAVKKMAMLSKSLLPLPSQWHGLTDAETRFRKRYLDILFNSETKKLFEKKAAFWNSIRRSLLGEGFLEVETPVLETIPGGAEAEPFVTHHNALNQDFYLRISLELPLKRLMVAGFEKVFEIGRIFRNEGIDAEHLQDYTQMEMYWAYQDYHGLMKFLEKTLKSAIKETCGKLVTVRDGKTIAWGKKWPRLDYYTLFKKGTGIDLSTTTHEALLAKAMSLNIPGVSREMGEGRLIDLLFKHTVRHTLIQPAFLINPPLTLEPLAKRSEEDSNRVERFQIVACGTELGKGFSELNDPLDQRKRFEDQMALRERGDKEAQMIDEDYLEAMEYGMPPTAGFGVSERFFAILMDKPVRETVIFPLVRKK
ncbi:MAG: lysine--tRNA ligase [Patescibacteria group bacterium]